MNHEIAHMRGHSGGAIINTASMPTTMIPGLAAYGATKAAVLALSRAAAREHLREGIRINTVSPGPVDTTMSLGPGETDADRDARLATQHPLGRVATTDAIAAAVLWLATPEAGYTIGHDLVVDGGASA